MSISRNRRCSGFTIHELLVVMVLVLVVVAFNVPADAAARRTARRMQNSTQLRGIHQALVTFANSNKNKFAGLSSKGDIIENGLANTGNSGDGDTVQARYWILLKGDFFTPEYAISPSETADVDLAFDWQFDNGPGVVRWDNNLKHYSYAMLGIKGTAGEGPDAAFAGRAAEWQQTLNSQAIVLSDRNTGTNATDQVESIHTGDRSDWTGSVLWNDNHVGFEQEQFFETKYANGALNSDQFGNGTDNLFDSERDRNGLVGVDALMVIAGDDTVHAGE